MQNFIRAVQILLLSKLWGPGPPRLDICINHKIFTRARLHPLDIERQFINKILFFKILVSYIQWWRPDREQRTTERTTQRPRNRETLPWTLNRSRRGHNPVTRTLGAMIHVRVFSVFTIGSHYHTVHAGILHHTKHFSPRGF